MSKFVGAIDQGTTSSRFILFDKDGNIGHIDQREHEQINPKAGWVEHDATEIWQNTRRVINGAMSDSDVEAGDVEAIGITNQRETTVVWDRETGEPIYNAIVWQDTRTGGLVRELAGDEGVDRLRDVTGLPLSTYFSGPKITWLLDNVDGARKRAENGELLFGTIDSWVLWNLTGGKDGGLHITDVTNASRTLLMDLKTLDWHDEALDLMGVPRSMLPEIKASSEEYGEAQGLGDRRPPAVGHPRRPAGRDVRPDLLRARRRQEHVRHRLVPARQHRRGDRPHRRPAHHRRLQARRRQGHLRARGLDRGHRRADPVAARPAGDHRRGARGRGAGEDRRRQRRRLLRAGVQRPVRPALARRRPRGHRRADRLRQPRPTSPAPRWRRPPGRARRSSTPPTPPPTSRSTSCASTAA